jgi:hypothetical protein
MSADEPAETSEPKVKGPVDEDGKETLEPARPVGKPWSMARLKALFQDYGTIAIVTYFTIFFGTWGAFAAAISMGVEVEGAMAGAGTAGASYVATKLTQPLRIAATLALTPVVAAVVHRIRPRRAALKAIEETATVHRSGPAEAGTSGSQDDEDESK